MDRLTSLGHANGGGAIAGYDYAFDADSRMTSLASATDGTSTYAETPALVGGTEVDQSVWEERHSRVAAVQRARHDPEVALMAAAFAKVSAVKVSPGSLLDLSCDAIVSPANSFGDMGGGIDKAIDDNHRGAAQRAVRAIIAADHLGEMPVGVATVVRMGSARFPFLVAAPTMRVPGSVRGSVNAYLSMRALLVAVLRHNASGGQRIRSVGIPGLCTGVGGVPYGEAAEQMRTALDSVIGGRWRDVVHPALAPYASNFTFVRSMQ